MARNTLARRRTHTAARLYPQRNANDGGGGAAGAGSTGGSDGGAGSSSTGGSGDGAGSSSSTSSSSSSSSGDGARTYTQADLDRLIGERLDRDRQARDREAQRQQRTEAQRLADLERELEETRTAARRTKVAAKHGLADYEDLLGSGTDEELEAKAKRLVAGGLGKAGGNGGNGGGRARTQRRTVTETGGNAQTPKERAAAALRGLRGGGSTDAAD